MYSTYPKQAPEQTDSAGAGPAPSAQKSELVARADERLAHAYQQITLADKQLSRVNEQLSRLEHKARRRPARARPALRGLIGVLLTGGICAAAFAAQSRSGDEARLAIFPGVPQLVWASLPSSESATQPSGRTVQLATADAAIPQAIAAEQTAPSGGARTTASTSSDVTQMLETIARDLAQVQQTTEQLKTSQDQIARNNAELGEQLKAVQEQIARDGEKTAERLKTLETQMARFVPKPAELKPAPKPPATAPRPIATSSHQPRPTLPSPQARAHPQTPVSLRPE